MLEMSNDPKEYFGKIRKNSFKAKCSISSQMPLESFDIFL